MALPMGVLRFGKHIHFTGPAWENCPLRKAIETCPHFSSIKLLGWRLSCFG